MKIHDWLQNLNNLLTDLDCRAESTWLLHFEQLHAHFLRVRDLLLMKGGLLQNLH